MPGLVRASYRSIHRSIQLRLDRRRAKAALLASIEFPPTTFSEKVRYRMATDRRKILTIFADKVAVRDYVSERVGDHVLTELYAVTDRPETLVGAALPREFVLKPSHASGAVIVVGDHAPGWQRLPEAPAGWRKFQIRPESVDWDRLVECCRYWLGHRYEATREWAYWKAEPRLLVEELLLDEGHVAYDYKFCVFDGKVQVIYVVKDRFTAPRRNVYSPRWDPVEVEWRFPRGDADPRPSKLDEMIEVAERLGDQLDFARVDLYAAGERIVFGEITNYPEAGKASFDPAAFDLELGRFWNPATPRRPRWRSRRSRVS